MQRILRLGEYCCQAHGKVIDERKFKDDDLIIAREASRTLVFSPLGNKPRFPKLAIVGITPGAQSEKFAKLLKEGVGVELAARRSAFHGAHKTIRELLEAHGFLDALGIPSPADVNESDAIFTTSLVKCCLKVDGSYKWAAPEIAASDLASNCVVKRFVFDIGEYPTISHIIIFGEPGWDALSLLKFGGVSIKTHFENCGIRVLNLPHFAQNYQQRAIYKLHPSNDEVYFRAKPENRSYYLKASNMRSRIIEEVNRLASSRANGPALSKD